MKSISPIHFIDKLVKKNELGQSFTLIDHQREVLRLTVAFDSAQASTTFRYVEQYGASRMGISI